ncbi:MAG: site-specific DNA-methyltransferase [Bacteroidales bacterium]|nr:site-specific DNA-methyltransferase [Bacteroidales bacterium]
MIKDIKAQNENVKPTDGILAKLHADFPQCFNNEGKFDLEKLRQLIEPETDITKEGYGLDYLGKNYANLICCTESETVIQPDLEHNAKPENAESQNIYISGDNLDALKHLLKSYAGKIKCIYIDPPYNTGSDGFVYNDSFKFTAKDLQTKLGISEEKAKRILDLCTRGSSSHSAWLMFMAPRLMLASNLLAPDGVIFISIDDNEQANLKLLCDSIFGEENFVNHFAWIVNLTGRQISGKGAAKTWESIMCYSKNIEEIDVFKIDINFAKKDLPNTYKGFDKDVHEDEYGYYSIGDTLYNHNRKFNEETRPNLVFSIFYNPESKDIKTGEIGEVIENYVEILPHRNGDGRHKYHAWRWSKEKIKNEVFNLIVLQNENGYEVYTRQRDYSTTTLKDLITNISNGDVEFQFLFDGKKCFDYPKSTALLKTLFAKITTSDIILDFFSGSATTAHAVMKLNSEDGGNRKFIMVQLPEKTPKDSEANKAGYDTIDQIGQERIRRAAVKIKNDLQSSIDLNTAKLSEKEKKLETEVQQQKLFAEGENPLVKEIETIKAEIGNQQQILDNADFGFRHYTLQNVDQNTLDKMETFDPQWFEEPDILEQFGKETVLATWLLHDGYGFGEAKPLKISEYTAYHCGSHLYFIEGDNFDENAVTALIDKYNGVPDFNPQNIVLFGYSFSFTQTEMLKKNLNTLQNSTKELKFNIDIRY